LVTVGEVESALATEKVKLENIEKVNLELNKSLSESKVADQDKTEELCQAKREVEKLAFENKSLKDYVEKLGQHLNFENTGKITDVSDRQQRRNLSELKTHTEKSLWFSKTFGLANSTPSHTSQMSNEPTRNCPKKRNKK
jgi:Fic family protein